MLNTVCNNTKFDKGLLQLINCFNMRLEELEA